MDIKRDESSNELWLNQTNYLYKVYKVIQRFHMRNSKDVAAPLAQPFKLSLQQSPSTEAERKKMEKVPYANIIGSIMYCMICTRPDLAHGISVTSRYMKDYGREHWIALKWILRYIKGSCSTGIFFKKQDIGEKEALVGYCDSDYATNVDTRKSKTGYIFTLYGAAISWKSTLQPVVALSTTEDEYIALTEAVKEGKWLRGIINDFGLEQGVVKVLCGCNSAICLAKKSIFPLKK